MGYADKPINPPKHVAAWLLAAGGERAEAGPLAVVSEPGARPAWERFAAAVGAGFPVALAEPEEGARGADLAVVLARREARTAGAVWMATGGTTGGARFCRHRGRTLGAAACGFAETFPEIREHWSVLPAHHVGGLMPFLRAAACGGTAVAGNYRAWLAGRFATPPGRGACLSLVPTQLARLLAVPAADAFLRGFGMILAGGAALSPAVRAEAWRRGLPLAPCYGMTETAAMVTVLPPADFLRGTDGCGPALPHVRLSVDKGGRLSVDSAALFEGYLEASGFLPRRPGPWAAPDAGRWSPEGSLVVEGRLDRVINTGGKKVSAERVEQVLSGMEGVGAVFVFGEPDMDWGERVVAAVEVAESGKEAFWRARARALLAPEERPKVWLALERLPRTSAGKVDAAALRKSFSLRGE